MRSSTILSSALLFASTCTAWPAGWDSPFDVARQELAYLQKRAASSSLFNTDFTGVQGNTATTISSTSGSSDSQATATGTQTSSDAKETGSSSNTGKTTGSNTGKTSTGGPEPTTQTFNPEDPAGGITMLNPPATTTTFYKISDYVTFQWNYTSLSVTPSAVDILASCSTNGATYTIALNQSITGATQAVTWDTNAYQSSASVPLLMGEYTLIVHDAQQAVTAAPSPGYLAAYSQFTFGMYAKQSYTPLAGYVCATCSAAVAAAEVQTVWFLLGTASITVLSFGWFTGVAGLW